MRLFLYSIFITLTITLQAQDTIYFDRSGKIVKTADKAFRFEVRITNPDNPDRVSVKKINNIGLPTSYIEFKSEKDGIIHGIRKEWHDNGELKRKMNYHEGELHGELLTYWPDGSLRRRDHFKNGSLIAGKLWDIDGNEIEHFDFSVDPEFPGGHQHLQSFLGQNLRYPLRARRKSIEGVVVVGFIVERNGHINEAFVHTSVDRSIDREALRVVNLLPPFLPGNIEGEPQRFQYFLPISFKLN